MGGGSSGTDEPPEAKRLRRRQLSDLAQLDEQQNARVRRIMQAGRGMRAFKGSPDMRLRRGDFKSAPPPAPVASTEQLTQRQQMARRLYRAGVTTHKPTTHKRGVPSFIRPADTAVRKQNMGGA